MYDLGEGSFVKIQFSMLIKVKAKLPLRSESRLFVKINLLGTLSVDQF